MQNRLSGSMSGFEHSADISLSASIFQFLFEQRSLIVLAVIYWYHSHNASGENDAT